MATTTGGDQLVWQPELSSHTSVPCPLGALDPLFYILGQSNYHVVLHLIPKGSSRIQWQGLVLGGHLVSRLLLYTDMRFGQKDGANVLLFVDSHSCWTQEELRDVHY